MEYKKIEEVFEDNDCESFDTILSISSIDLLENKLKVLKEQGTDVHGIFVSHFHFFSTEQTLNFPKFIDWCACNYSSSERAIMDAAKSKILLCVSPLVIQGTFFYSC